MVIGNTPMLDEALKQEIQRVIADEVCGRPAPYMVFLRYYTDVVQDIRIEGCGRLDRNGRMITRSVIYLNDTAIAAVISRENRSDDGPPDWWGWSFDEVSILARILTDWNKNDEKRP